MFGFSEVLRAESELLSFDVRVASTFVKISTVEVTPSESVAAELLVIGCGVPGAVQERLGRLPVSIGQSCRVVGPATRERQASVLTK